MKGNCSFPLLLLACFLLSFVMATIASPQQLEVIIKKYDHPGYGVSTEFRVHLINRASEDVLLFPFFSGSAAAFFLVAQTGLPIPFKPYSPPSWKLNGYRRKGQYVLPGDCSGIVIPLEKFALQNEGVYFMVCAIPSPEGAGVVFSLPAKIVISKTGIESCMSISPNLLPSQVRATFHVEILKRFQEEKVEFNEKALSF